MPSSLFSQTPPARDTLYQQVHFLRREFTFANDGQVLTIGTVPAGASILKPLSGVQVNTVFNAGTNNFLDIGTSANDDLYGTDLSLATATFVPLDEAVSETMTAETTFIATVDLTGTAATTGEAVVIIAYATKNPPSGQPL